MYIMEFYGDMPGLNKELFGGRYLYVSVDEALRDLEKRLRDPSLNNHYGYELGDLCPPDPEDDRIVIWEANPADRHPTIHAPENQLIAVWHFSGWHWEQDAADLYGGPLEQGNLLGYDKSLYEMAMEDY